MLRGSASEPLFANVEREKARARTSGTLHFHLPDSVCGTDSDSDSAHGQQQKETSGMLSPRVSSSRLKSSRSSILSRRSRVSRKTSDGAGSPRQSCEVPVGHVMSLASGIARNREKPRFMLTQRLRPTLNCDSGGTMSDDGISDPVFASLPRALPRICVLGSDAVGGADRADHVTTLASRLAAILRRHAVILTSGQQGLQEEFVRGLDDFDDVFCVLAPDDASDARNPLVVRRLAAGHVRASVRSPGLRGVCPDDASLAELGDVLLVAGPQSVEMARQVAAALLRGALVLPLDAEAASGEPPLPRPDAVPERQWAVLTARPRTPEAIDAIVEAVSRRVLGSSVVDALEDMLSRRSHGDPLHADQPTPGSTEIVATGDAAEEASHDTSWQESMPTVAVSLLVPLAFILF